MAQTVILYPTGKAQQYPNVSRAAVEGGVLTFYWTTAGSYGNKKIVTNAPFVMEEDVA